MFSTGAPPAPASITTAATQTAGVRRIRGLSAIGPTPIQNVSQVDQLQAERLEDELLRFSATMDDNIHPDMMLLVADRLIEHT